MAKPSPISIRPLRQVRWSGRATGILVVGPVLLLVDIAADLIDLTIGVPYLQRNCRTGALAPQPFGVNPQASRHEPVRLVDPDRPDPLIRWIVLLVFYLQQGDAGRTVSGLHQQR